MTDNPQEPQDRRRAGRTGPLGDDSDETRQIPRQGSDDEARTQAIPTNERADSRARDEKETRVIRTDGSQGGVSQGTTRQDSGAYARGYFESEEDRTERLREIYGGVDWLASFLGFIFAVVAGSFLFGVASLILVPLGVSVEIGGALTAAAITALVLLAVLIFITYLFGGYVSGRLARFDGGRNGAMSVVWALLVGFLLFVAGTVLPGSAGESVRTFYEGSLIPAASGLLALGIAGIAIVIGVVIIAILGGIVGGKIGSRYHEEIDQTT